MNTRPQTQDTFFCRKRRRRVTYAQCITTYREMMAAGEPIISNHTKRERGKKKYDPIRKSDCFRCEVGKKNRNDWAENKIGGSI